MGNDTSSLRLSSNRGSQSDGKFGRIFPHPGPLPLQGERGRTSGIFWLDWICRVIPIVGCFSNGGLSQINRRYAVFRLV
ncbi:hypothetical protein Cflav_PD3316 [Pedosphaera parvula Ellin514]|uniref:Uncharacterized protein n=1 Tax=Pedosphaera parvula (strain Ellin514) TaxID=320771 RepID=B9XI85_PEDPL|nr:hypothetical protein Cflav_PD3316 [Pedosphaera parvula Ellin514]